MLKRLPNLGDLTIVVELDILNSENDSSAGINACYPQG